MRIQIFLLLAAFSLVGCQQKQTKTFQTETLLRTQNESVQKFLEGNPVVIDVRTPYDFNLFKVPGSVSIQWQDFSETTPGHRGYLQKDKAALARRLALVGVSPERAVLIIGYGLGRSLGEEGRVAWMLKSLGVQEVRIVQISELKALNPRAELPPKNAPYWAPKEGFDGNLDRALFKALVGQEEPTARYMTKARAKALQMPRVPAGPLRLEKLGNKSVQEVRKDFILVDARPEFKMQQEPLRTYLPLLREPIHIDWKKLYRPDGQIQTEAQRTMLEIFKATARPILVYGDYGLESAALAFALNSLGFTHVFHYEGGIEELRGAP